ncbi:MAG: hypothetical protein AAFP96_01915, partial [Bacteroidota bacterium]
MSSSCGRAQEAPLPEKREFSVKSEILGEEIPVTTFGSLNRSGHIEYVTDGQKWLENRFIDTIDRI